MQYSKTLISSSLAVRLETNISKALMDLRGSLVLSAFKSLSVKIPLVETVLIIVIIYKFTNV